VDIDLPTLLLRVRAGEISPPDQIRAGSKDTSSQPNQALGLPWTVKQGLRLFTWAATSPWRFRLAQKFAGIAGSLTTPKSTWMNLPAFTGWGYSKDIPRPASQSFEQWWKTQTRDRQRIQKRQGNHIEKPEAGSIQESTPTQPESQTGESPNPLSIFKTELTNLDGEFTRCTSKELPECIASYLQAREINEIASWSEDNLPEGLLDKLQENGIKIVQQVRPDIRCGLTGATAAVAETGTLLLASGPGRSQLTSLLPEIHLAILNEKDIYENLSQALSLKEVAEASSVALISGPSRTADIEMTLTIGVHGPTEVQVFCLP
jgi:L-lactate dehydrogenase complex protein LldG